MLFDYLDRASSTWLGLSSKTLYPLYMEQKGRYFACVSCFQVSYKL